MNESRSYPVIPGQEMEPVVPFSEWLKLFCIGFIGMIPGVGWIIMLVLYIVKASDVNQPRSLRNAVTAGFIMTGISFALTIILVLFLIGLFAGLMSSYWPNILSELEQYIDSYAYYL